jgi:hypothetical protein
MIVFITNMGLMKIKSPQVKENPVDHARMIKDQTQKTI